MLATGAQNRKKKQGKGIRIAKRSTQHTQNTARVYATLLSVYDTLISDQPMAQTLTSVTL